MSSIETCLQIIHLMPGNVYWKDTSGIYEGCNINFAMLLNRTIDQVIGKTDRDFFEPVVLRHLKNIDRRVMRDVKAWEGEEIYRDITYLSQKIPLTNKKGECTGLLGISFDISERKRQQKELEDAHKTQSIIISNFSHETKTPLAIIQQSLQIIKAKKPDPEYQAYIDYIDANTQALLDQVTKVAGLADKPTNSHIERSDERGGHEQSFTSRR